jgi:hypothetical protein
MSMGDLSIFYCLIRFLSSVVYCCPYRGHSHPLFSFFSYVFDFVFEAIINGIVSLYSFSICSSLDRKATDFCKLISYTATLLKLFIMSRSFIFFLVDFFGSYRYKINLSANRGSFDLFLTYLYSFYFYFLSSRSD